MRWTVVFQGLLLVLFVLLVLVLILYSKTPSLKEEEIRRVNYEFVKNLIKTGDLLVFSHDGFTESMIRLYTNSPFTHTSIVYCDRKGEYGPVDEFYVLENHPNSQFDHVRRMSGLGGPVMISLEDKLVNYNGSFVVLSNSKIIPEEKLIEEHLNLLDREFVLTPSMWLFDRSSTFSCCDYVSKILERTDISNPIKPHHDYIPRDFMNLNEFSSRGAFSIAS